MSRENARAPYSPLFVLRLDHRRLGRLDEDRPWNESAQVLYNLLLVNPLDHHHLGRLDEDRPWNVSKESARVLYNLLLLVYRLDRHLQARAANHSLEL